MDYKGNLIMTASQLDRMPGLDVDAAKPPIIPPKLAIAAKGVRR